MSRHRLSLSRYWLALECSYWARADLQWEEQPSGRAGRVGTICHRFAELCGKTLPFDGDPVLEAADPHELAEAKAIFEGPLRGWVEKWRDAPIPAAFELRLRYDTRIDDVHQAKRRDEEGYEPPGPSQVTGELDFVHNHVDSVDVVDLKTGSPRNVHDEQVITYGLLASRFYRVPKVRVAFLFARKTKLTQTDWIELDADTLDAEAGRLARTLRLLPDARPRLGDHCVRCPMPRSQCPAQVERHRLELEAAWAAEGRYA